MKNSALFLFMALGILFLSACNPDQPAPEPVEPTEPIGVVEKTEVDTAATAETTTEDPSMEEEPLAEAKPDAKPEEKPKPKPAPKDEKGPDGLTDAEREAIRLEKERIDREEAIKNSQTETVAPKPTPAPAPKPTPAPPPPKPVDAPKIKFETTKHDFGTIKEGDVVKYQFFFKNTGTAPLIIKDATATCGCTAPGYSFLPIEPGDESAINVSFNSKGKFGPQKPEVTVLTNTYPSKFVLTLEGVVDTGSSE